MRWRCIGFARGQTIDMNLLLRPQHNRSWCSIGDSADSNPKLISFPLHPNVSHSQNQQLVYNLNHTLRALFLPSAQRLMKRKVDQQVCIRSDKYGLKTWPSVDLINQTLRIICIVIPELFNYSLAFAMMPHLVAKLIIHPWLDKKKQLLFST